MKIYKKIFSLLLTVIIIHILFSQKTYSSIKGNIKYDSILVDYSRLDEKSIKKDADKYFSAYINSNKKDNNKEKFLNLALNNYYLLSKMNPADIINYTQLGRIYDYKKNNKLAKEYFYRAINIEANNPFTNFYFGDYYFKRRDYKNALKYYKVAYNNGYNKQYEINLRLAIIYEKLADLVNAKNFYEISYNIKPDNKILEKIQLLNELNYDKSEYYHIIRE